MTTPETFFQPTPADRGESWPQAARIGLNILIVGLWLWLYRPVYGYLAVIFSREDFRTNQIILLAVVGLILWQIRQGAFRPRLDGRPRLFPPALGLALGGSVLFLAVERFLDINTLSASLFGLASYGLLGLWLSPERWRQGLPAALLLIGVLPFGEHMQTFIGYPMRILTAGLVRDGLAAAGVATIGVDTILIFENGVSQVDLPCSGVKSLWTGLLFLIAATWIERRPLNLRWLLITFVFAALLFAANLSRVAVLVTIGEVAGWGLAAELLHVPLGVLGFAAACAAVMGLLRSPLNPPCEGGEHAGQMNDLRAYTNPLCEGGEHAPNRLQLEDFSILQEQSLEASQELNLFSFRRILKIPSQPLWLGPGVALVILGMGLIYTPRPEMGLAQAPPGWEFPEEMTTEPMPLKPDEIDWLTRDGAESADRRRFEWRGVRGSMILITSTTWRAHHRPERCFEVYGLSIDDSRTHLAGPDFPLRVVALGEGSDRFGAVYWFQSAGQTTDDYGSRIWADLTPERERWVLVSILFDNVEEPRAAEMEAFYNALHEAVERGLAGD
jgi:exosortase/archaeosortase family protein